MPRQNRKYSYSKTYHIIIKGNDDQDIFYDDKDREFFLKRILKTKKLFNYDIYAYCLMSNHVHMVIKIQNDFLSKAIQSLTASYAQYFNKKYKRKGPFVQNRFKSKNVENQKYFLEVCRYVHRNPEKSYIAKTEDYKWSSYKEYIGKERLINKKILLHYYNDDLNEFIKYTKNISDIEELNTFAEYEMIGKLTDEQLTRIIMKKFDIDNVEDIAEFFRDKSKSEEKRCLKEVKNILGTNITQVARVTRIGRKKIEKIWNEE